MDVTQRINAFFEEATEIEMAIISELYFDGQAPHMAERQLLIFRSLRELKDNTHNMGYWSGMNAICDSLGFVVKDGCCSFAIVGPFPSSFMRALILRFVVRCRRLPIMSSLLELATLFCSRLL